MKETTISLYDRADMRALLTGFPHQVEDAVRIGVWNSVKPCSIIRRRIEAVPGCGFTYRLPNGYSVTDACDWAKRA